MNIAIIGAGWSGLAAASELVRHKHNVTVYEAARQPGGRARAVAFNNSSIDNGQHILVGAYTSVLRLLKRYGVDESSVFKRLPLNLYLWRAADHKQSVRLQAWNLPAPLHLALGLLSMKGMSWENKIRMLYALHVMRNTRFSVDTDLPLLDYLKSLRQSDDLVTCLWQPLCISILNTPIEQASTELFLRVIKDAFFAGSSDSDLLLPVTDLGDCFPEPAVEYIEKNGGNIRLGMRVDSIIEDADNLCGIKVNNKTIQVDQVIIATAPEAAYRLLQTIPSLLPLAENINRLGSLPITTVYLQYPETVSLPEDFIGILNSHSQWFFDRGRLTGSKGTIAVVISGPGKHMGLSSEELSQIVQNELASHFPSWPKPLSVKVIREKRATMNTRPGINNIRPANETEVTGLWLAGDYTSTGYPSTLEGAVRSGLACAQEVIRLSEKKQGI